MTLNERCAMTLNELRALADDFFEWPIAHNKSTVTLFSALLFAQHVLQLREKSLGTGNSASTPTLRDAAQQALEALEQDNPAGRTATIAALRAALEQQAEPEPVAWMCPEDPDRETAFYWRPGHCENCGKQRIPLYTAPPQRKPLTDAEIQELSQQHKFDSRMEKFVRVIERAHGIGEGV